MRNLDFFRRSNPHLLPPALRGCVVETVRLFENSPFGDFNKVDQAFYILAQITFRL
jgi:hypothetical protein